jgi:hypothetical protein
MIDPVTGALIGGAVLKGIGGAASYFSGKDANADLINAYKELEFLPLEERVAKFEEFKLAGVITPEQEAEILAQDSELRKIQTDPSYKRAQMQALSQMSRMGREGLLLQDKASLANVAEQSAAAERGRQQAILQQRQARGVAGSGDELAAQLASNQASAQAQASAGRDIASQARQRALEAVARSGEMAGSMQKQEYGQSADAARAQDLINQFNVQMRTGTQQRNVSGRNLAQEKNIFAKQNVMDKNVGLQNQQYRDQVAAKLALAEEKNKAKLGMAQSKTEQNIRDASALGGMFGATGDAALGGAKIYKGIS